VVRNGLVAVKRLSKTFDMHESTFHKEVECLMKTKHKNIVRFLGYCSDTQGKLVDYEGKLVMADIRNWLLCFEYVPGGSLDNYITDASRGLEWRERYQIIKGICEGVQHLHEKRILHLDLKPGNVLIDDQMIPKITDFGLSRCLDKEQSRVLTAHICGSQGYLAPELYSGQMAFASDIFGLGVIIVEILTGKKSYPEDDKVRKFMCML
jgi:serine/threonine protein kinase